MQSASKGTITIVAHEVRPDGGMERAMLETIEALLESGWRIHLIARVCTIKNHPGLRFVRVPTPRRPFPLAFPLFAVVAGTLLARRSPKESSRISLGAIIPNRVDVVTVQFCQAGFARHRLSRASRNSWGYRVNTILARNLSLAMERWCYRPGRVARMTAVSALIRDELRACYPSLSSTPIDVIPNGVDVSRFAPNPVTRSDERQRRGLTDVELVAIFAGGDWQRKGLLVAIEAAASANWTLIVVGRGDIAEWSAIARQRGARVHFLGHLTQPERAYCAADAFMLPSLYEGFALVTIEAAASGLPLLVTPATGAADLAKRSGMHPLPREAEAFAAVLESLGNDEAARLKIGRDARSAAEQLAWPRVVSNYVRVYARSSSVVSHQSARA